MQFITKWGLASWKASMKNAYALNYAKRVLITKLWQSITVYYEDEVVGQFAADIIVNDTVILELKSCPSC